MKIRYTIKFLLHKRAADDDRAALRMRFSMHGDRFDIPMHIHVDVSKWDVTHQRITGATRDALSTNHTIGEWRTKMEELMATYELIEKRIPSMSEIKDKFNIAIGRDYAEFVQQHNFFHLWDKFTQSEGAKNQWSESTFKKFRGIKKHVVDFNPNLSFDILNEDTMQDYLTYLNSLGFKNTTISKEISYIHWFLRWAATRGYYTGNVQKTFKPKLKGTDGNSKEIIYLTPEEIQRMRDYQFKQDEKYLEETRDVFLFCCFTGLRFSDVEKLRTSDIKNNFITVVTQKTTDGLRIELNKHSRAILEKYKHANLPRYKALPVKHNQVMNRQIKDVAQMCGIDEPTRIVYFQGSQRQEDVLPKYELITTHCGRRTFVVTALRLGIPAEVIMKWTGHSDFDAMKPYIKIVDELKEREMTRFDNFL